MKCSYKLDSSPQIPDYKYQRKKHHVTLDQSHSSNEDTSLNSTKSPPLCYKQEAGKKVASGGKGTQLFHRVVKQRQMQTNKNAETPLYTTVWLPISTANNIELPR